MGGRGIESLGAIASPNRKPVRTPSSMREVIPTPISRFMPALAGDERTLPMPMSNAHSPGYKVSPRSTHGVAAAASRARPIAAIPAASKKILIARTRIAAFSRIGVPAWRGP